MAYDPVLCLVGISNLGEKHNWIYSFSIGVWSGHILPIQCEIITLKLTIDLLLNASKEEAHLLNLIHLDEMRREAQLANEAHKKRIKVQYNKNFQPRIFSEGDLVLLYDQDAGVIGTGKFEPLWHGPYIFKRFLAKGAYELVDYDGIPLAQPRNGLYLKCYYA